MRRIVLALAVLGLVVLLVAPADARKRHRHKPSGVEGVVLNASCPGPCVEPQVPEPVYSGAVTVTVQRASDGAQVASQIVSDGRFRFKLKRGVYDVSVVPPTVVPPPCPPGFVCIADAPGQASVMIANCLAGETKRVEVRRHRFTHIELHVTNVCIA